MDINLIRQILETARETGLREIIPSTMGEPLLYKHFDEIVQMCHQYGIKLNLTTNGTFPGKGAETWAKELVSITSDVKISWNGATKETQEKIMIGTNWEKVLTNIKTFIGVRDNYAREGKNYCTLTFQLTFLKTNVDELADIVKLAIDLGVNRVKGHHLWAHFDEIKHLSMRSSDASIDRWNQAVYRAQAVAKEFLLPNGKHILLENINFLDNTAQFDLDPKAACPFLGKEAWVSAEGRFGPCCAPDKQRQQLGDFGNLYETNLDHIWTSPLYESLQKNYKTHPLCVGCNMRKSDT
jgi:MoaA/NifB/PqqE/SkfB family radical SAM enzyme